MTPFAAFVPVTLWKSWQTSFSTAVRLRSGAVALDTAQPADLVWPAMLQQIPATDLGNNTPSHHFRIPAMMHHQPRAVHATSIRLGCGRVARQFWGRGLPKRLTLSRPAGPLKARTTQHDCSTSVTPKMAMHIAGLLLFLPKVRFCRITPSNVVPFVPLVAGQGVGRGGDGAA